MIPGYQIGLRQQNYPFRKIGKNRVSSPILQVQQCKKINSRVPHFTSGYGCHDNQIWMTLIKSCFRYESEFDFPKLNLESNLKPGTKIKNDQPLRNYFYLLI